MPTNNALTRWAASRILLRCLDVIRDRHPDFVIGERRNPYLRRWYLLPRNPIFNVYLHQFMRDDEDRALHDHPWPSVSLALNMSMVEVYLERHRTLDGPVVIERTRTVSPGDLLYRGARFTHRMIVPIPGALTLFITGPRIRTWGFWCENKRFVHFKEFLDDKDRGLVGKGCE